MTKESRVEEFCEVTRREFLIKSLGVAAGLAANSFVGAASASKRAGQVGSFSVASKAASSRPNILFISLDQISCDSIHAHGCQEVSTPNLDRLIQSGISFTQSYSANPVCCPARSSWFTGRYTPETGVMTNDYKMTPKLPDLGQWLGARGYSVNYAGKWHIPGRLVGKSFTALGPDPHNTAATGDFSTRQATEGFLHNYSGNKPFFLSTGLLNPHDICSFSLTNHFYKGRIPYGELRDQLPPLPANFHAKVKEPQALVKIRIKDGTSKTAGVTGWTEDYWRYYIWAYHRYIETVDGHVGMILHALENSKFADNTLVILAADHGDGHGCHQLTLKNFLYDEASRVPFILSWPGHVRSGVIDTDHLVSGVDLLPTVCDYAGIEAPPKMRGYSLRPLAEGSAGIWRDFVVAHAVSGGRMLRTNQHKLIKYDNDPVLQLFDMQNDPMETTNLAESSANVDLVKAHEKQLADFESHFEIATLDKSKGPGGGTEM